MSKGIVRKEPDPEIVYAEIFRLPHHVSDHHPPMSLYDRAAQFAPYKTLSGYEDMVNEEARLVDHQIELSPDDLALLNEKLSLIADVIEDGMKPELSVTRFIPDPLKAGGRYETITDVIRKVDTAEQKLILERTVGRAGAHMEISIADILEIHGDLVDDMDID